jgi:hypothetical protein
VQATGTQVPRVASQVVPGAQSPSAVQVVE